MLTQYFKPHNLADIKKIDNQAVLLVLEYPANNAPDHRVESAIWLWKDGMEARVYYTALGATICKGSERKEELYRLLNFINARLLLRAADAFGNRLYKPHMLYTPRFYMTEDDAFDITMTTIIDYDFYELAPLETADYISIFCPELLNALSMPIFWVLLGNTSAKESIDYIKRTLLNE